MSPASFQGPPGHPGQEAVLIACAYLDTPLKIEAPDADLKVRAFGFGRGWWRRPAHWQEAAAQQCICARQRSGQPEPAGDVRDTMRVHRLQHARRGSDVRCCSFTLLVQQVVCNPQPPAWTARPRR